MGQPAHACPAWKGGPSCQGASSAAAPAARGGPVHRQDPAFREGPWVAPLVVALQAAWPWAGPLWEGAWWVVGQGRLLPWAGAWAPMVRLDLEGR